MLLISVQRSRCRRHPPAGGFGRPEQVDGILAGWPMFPAGRARNLGGVEIRLVLDRIDPLTGHLRVVDGPYDTSDVGAQISFAGWLGLLRALYSVTGGPGSPVIRAT